MATNDHVSEMTIFEFMLWVINYSVEYDLCLLTIQSAKTDKDILGFCIGSVRRKCFLRCYKLFKPIESLPEVEKKELWSFVKENFPGKDKDELIENVKIVYTSSKLTETK